MCRPASPIGIPASILFYVAAMARFWMGLALAVTLPAIALRLGGVHLAPGADAATYGTAILGAAFLLTWASEVAELDMAKGLALALLALIAVLPEYAVDLYFAWRAGQNPEYTAYATANMTGANRLLIGIAWPLIVFLHWCKTRRGELLLPQSRSVELVFLSIATLYSFVIPLKGTISALDMAVLIALFVAYMWRISGAPPEEPELVGPAALMARLQPAWRRACVAGLFLFSAAVILGAAEPFAEALLASGRTLGVDEFLLVQWLAPFASEAPEVAIACILTLKGDAEAGIGAMVSAKVNQWTLLIGTLPLVFSISHGSPAALHLDARQIEEILLTAAQSAFAVAVLANMRLSLLEAAGLLFLFLGQLAFPDPVVRYAFSAVYLALAVWMIFRRRKLWPGFFRAGLRGGGEVASDLGGS